MQPFGQPLVKPHPRGQRGPGYYNVGGLWPSTTPRTSEGRATTIWAAVGTVSPSEQSRAGLLPLGRPLVRSLAIGAGEGRVTTTWVAFGGAPPSGQEWAGILQLGRPLVKSVRGISQGGVTTTLVALAGAPVHGASERGVIATWAALGEGPLSEQTRAGLRGSLTRRRFCPFDGSAV